MSISQLIDAQRAMSPEAEAAALRRLLPVRKRAGRQHERTPTLDRLMSSIRFGATDCWHWCAFISNGYGRFTFKGRMQLAHRVAYETFKGPIPSGLFVLHSCDNRACINPDHLSLGTYADNRRDCQAKGRWKLKNVRRGFSHQSSTTTPDRLHQMRAMRASGSSYATIGKAMGAPR